VKLKAASIVVAEKAARVPGLEAELEDARRDGQVLAHYNKKLEQLIEKDSNQITVASVFHAAVPEMVKWLIGRW